MNCIIVQMNEYQLLQVAIPLLAGTVEEGTSVGRAAAEPMEGGSVGNEQGTSPMDE